MTHHNPEPGVTLDYHAAPPRPRHAAAITRAVGTVFLACFLFALGGGLLGLLLGVAVPEYYRSVFPRANADPNFNPPAVGFGLGVTQGAALGALVGVALAFILAWRETRLRPTG